MEHVISVGSKLPDVGVSIFAVMTRLANEHGAINLSQGFPDFDCDPALVDAVARAMRAGHNQYAPMPGVLALREAIAGKVQRCYGADLRSADRDSDRLRRDGGLYATLTAFVQPGDEVILFEPCYDSYVPVIRLSGGTPVFVSLRYPDYRVDWDEVQARASRRAPGRSSSTRRTTRRAWRGRADDMRQLAALVDGTDILLIGDEVYEHIIFDGRRHESLLRYPELRARACVISSFGKTFHTTGWKVGYCVAPPPILAEVQRVHQFMTFTVHTPSQFAFAEFVARDPLASSCAGSTSRSATCFCSLIEGSRFKPLACEGTYFQLLDYSAIAQRHRPRHGDAPDHRAWRGVDSVLGVPLQGWRRARAAVLLCQEGRDAARGGRTSRDDLITGRCVR